MVLEEVTMVAAGTHRGQSGGRKGQPLSKVEVGGC